MPKRNLFSPAAFPLRPAALAVTAGLAIGGCAAELRRAGPVAPPVPPPAAPPALRVAAPPLGTPLLPDGVRPDPEGDVVRALAESLGRPVEAGASSDASLHRLAAGVLDLVVLRHAGARPRPGVAFSLPYDGLDGPRVFATRTDDWELRRRIHEVLIARALGERDPGRHSDDLDGIAARGTLRMITRRHPTSWFLHEGAERGFEYELLRRFARRQDLALEVVCLPPGEDPARWLAEGRGDVAAAALTPAAPDTDVRWTHLAARVGLALAVRAEDAERVRAEGPGGRVVAVRGSARAWTALAAVGGPDGPVMEVLPEETPPEDLLAELEAGTRDAVLVDAPILAREILAGRPLADAGRLGGIDIRWAVRTSNPALHAALDAYLADQVERPYYRFLWARYFHDPAGIEGLHPAGRSDRSGRVSPYDELARHFAARWDLDWRLVVAQMYQESRFDPASVSPAGAEGLMQLIPGTARELAVSDPHDPVESVRGGTEYLRRMMDFFEPELPLAVRLRFALASYNAGYGHVRDARYLATLLGLDPDRWYGHVEKAILLMEDPAYARLVPLGGCIGSETAQYVANIDRRYRLYLAHVPDPQDQRARAWRSAFSQPPSASCRLDSSIEGTNSAS